MSHAHLSLRNGEAARFTEVPTAEIDPFRESVLTGVERGTRLVALTALPQSAGASLLAVLADETQRRLHLVRSSPIERYQALTPECPEAHLFEREIFEQTGVEPTGHPWLKPVRFPQRRDGTAARPGVMGFCAAEGTEIHEVAVGPVHAGVIEPGHFRFLCHGEDVSHLEISLGYQHRGVERALLGGPGNRSIHLAETLAGDTTIGHATALCHAIEGLANARVPWRAHAIRGIGLELERLANHAGDIGALANDVGFLPTANYCGRLRGEFLNMSALICGSRFGRGLVRPGGVGFDIEPPRAEQLAAHLKSALRDVRGAANLLWEGNSVRSRFEETGAIAPEDAHAIGLVGPAARACGIERDVRRDFPSGIYRFFHLPVCTWPSCDVFARAFVRWMEIEQSAAFILGQLGSLPPGEITAPAASPAPDSIVVSLVEGWRGEICHTAITGADGRFLHYKVVDPSFHNWFGLALALRGQQISDFPLCNKSFNLSYCGFDL